MRRTTSMLMAAMLVVGSLAAFPVAGLAAETDTAQTEPARNESTEDANASVAPGAQLAGVVGVQQAEFEGDVESRAYGIQVAQAQTDASKAAVVAERLGSIESRLDELDRRKRALETARSNGSMSEGEYRAKMATLHARTQQAERMANRTDDTAADLPADVLEAQGVNVTAIRALRERASDLRGPEVAAIAQSIAGENAGQSARPVDPKRQGPDRTRPSDATPGNETRGPPADGTGPGTADADATETATATSGDGSGGSTTGDGDSRESTTSGGDSDDSSDPGGQSAGSPL